MCGGGAPQDNSAEVARIEAAAAREAREAREREEAAELARFESALNSAYTNAVGSAEDFFVTRGLDPNEYRGQISEMANRLKGSVPHLDTSPGTYFDALGQRVFDRAEEGQRSQFMRDISQFAPSGFENRRITNDVDDAFIDSVLAERRGDAESYLRNLLDRGVITNSGFSSGLKDLDRQSLGATSRLNEIGLGLLEGGRTDASNIASEARSAASNFNLGEFFDPFEFQTDLNNHFGNFFDTLGDKIRTSAPTNLFDTSGLAGIAGAGQGAQNTPFDPQALAGIFNEKPEEEDDQAPISPF